MAPKCKGHAHDASNVGEKARLLPGLLFASQRHNHSSSHHSTMMNSCIGSIGSVRTSITIRIIT